MTKKKKCTPKKPRRVMVMLELETALSLSDLRHICRYERGKRSRMGTVLQASVNVIREKD